MWWQHFESLDSYQATIRIRPTSWDGIDIRSPSGLFKRFFKSSIFQKFCQRVSFDRCWRHRGRRGFARRQTSGLVLGWNPLGLELPPLLPILVLYPCTKSVATKHHFLFHWMLSRGHEVLPCPRNKTEFKVKRNWNFNFIGKLQFLLDEWNI